MNFKKIATVIAIASASFTSVACDELPKTITMETKCVKTVKASLRQGGISHEDHVQLIEQCKMLRDELAQTDAQPVFVTDYPSESIVTR